MTDEEKIYELNEKIKIMRKADEELRQNSISLNTLIEIINQEINDQIFKIGLDNSPEGEWFLKGMRHVIDMFANKNES
jgi:hypothetical protein